MKRPHLFPSRTQKLSSFMPTILGWRRPGKIGLCQFDEGSEVIPQSFFVTKPSLCYNRGVKHTSIKEEILMVSKILVVDDETNILEILRENLEREGYEVFTAKDGEQALTIHALEQPSLILLDCMLPGLTGFDVCKKIRSYSDVPIVMLTARSEEIDKVLGLELGADDYITKPFSMREVMARVKAHLRRSGHLDGSAQPVEQILRYGDLTIDLVAYQVKVNDEVVPLTLREFELLKCLAVHPGQVFSREQLLYKVWGYEYYGDVRTVDVTVRRTREKLEPDALNNGYRYIMTKRGVGYYFEKGKS